MLLVRLGEGLRPGFIHPFSRELYSSSKTCYTLGFGEDEGGDLIQEQEQEQEEQEQEQEEQEGISFSSEVRRPVEVGRGTSGDVCWKMGLDVGGFWGGSMPEEGISPSSFHSC